MSRPPLGIGTAGNITTKTLVSGRWEARARFRDYDGRTRQLRKTGASRAAAERALKAAIRDRTRTGATDELTGDSPLSVLAELWLLSRESEGSVAPQTLDQYRSNVSLHILPALGCVRIREASTGRVDAYFRSLKYASTAKMSRVVLNGMFALSSRHDVIAHNPVRDATVRKGTKPQTRALTVDEIKVLRANVIEWQSIKHYGPSRGTDALEIIDVMLGTGFRPGETFALRWDEVDLHSVVPTATVVATAVTRKGEGLIRQGSPKSASSRRTVVLPPFAADALRRQRARDLPSDGGYVFPSAAGTLRGPGNFARILRAARGDTLGWVQPYTFRRTAATLIERTFGVDAASAVLGHSDTVITQRHYIERAKQAPDVAEAFAGVG